MSRLTDHYQCYLEKSVNPSRENLTPRAANRELSDQSRDSPSDQLKAPHRNSIKKKDCCKHAKKTQLYFGKTYIS